MDLISNTIQKKNYVDAKNVGRFAFKTTVIRQFFRPGMP